jgi:hypothetical protein
MNTNPERTISEDAKRQVAEAFSTALETMREHGFDIGDGVQVAVDPTLPFMGYTKPEGKKFKITVSGDSIESGMLEGLLVHEMSHIYRMRTNHPSHNARIIDSVIRSLGEFLHYDYQQKIVGDLVNNIEDLYADDISIKVVRGGLVSEDQLSDFLQDWVKDGPVETGDSVRDRWVNASIMANNARAIGQMTRQEIEDVDGRAEARSGKFLHLASPEISTQYEYFLNTLINLKEDIPPDEYRKLLGEYLNRFLSATKMN